jgi:hypothetical protein
MKRCKRVIDSAEIVGCWNQLSLPHATGVLQRSFENSPPPHIDGTPPRMLRPPSWLGYRTPAYANDLTANRLSRCAIEAPWAVRLTSRGRCRPSVADPSLAKRIPCPDQIIVIAQRASWWIGLAFSKFPHCHTNSSEGTGPLRKLKNVGWQRAEGLACSSTYVSPSSAGLLPPFRRELM